jgi:hypothetical protein
MLLVGFAQLVVPLDLALAEVLVHTTAVSVAQPFFCWAVQVG